MSRVLLNNHPHVLLYSRGRGRGHAVRDIGISAALRQISPGIRITLVSYATGLHAFREAGFEAIDADLPEFPAFSDNLVAAAKIIARTEPDIVIAQEDIAALVAAKVSNLPTLLETHWFPHPRACNRAAYRYADRILFMEESGLFEEPEEIRGRVRYVGPFVRPLNASPMNRDLYRKELCLGQDDFFLLVIPGSYPEDRSEICELVYDAFMILDCRHKRLRWIAGNDFHYVREKLPISSQVEIHVGHPEIHKWMIAADVLITKGTYNITKEADVLHVPTIVLSHHKNPADDTYAARSVHSTLLSANGLKSKELSALIQTKAATIRSTDPVNDSNENRPGAELIAAEIVEFLASCTLG